jgi:hypothetical protein
MFICLATFTSFPAVCHRHLSAPTCRVQRSHVCSPASKLWIYATDPMTKSQNRVALMPTYVPWPFPRNCCIVFFLAAEVHRDEAGAVTERANDATRRRRRWGCKLQGKKWDEIWWLDLQLKLVTASTIRLRTSTLFRMNI